MSFLARTLRATAAVCCLLLAGSVAAAEQPPNASGTLKVNTTTVNLHHAYAFLDADGSTRVLIASRPVSAAMLAEESSGESSGEGPTFRSLVKKGEVSAIELHVTPEREVVTVTAFDKGFDMPTPTTGHNFWYEPYRMTAGWIGGRSRTHQRQSFFDTKWEYDVSFFAPVGKKSFDVATAETIAAQRKDVDAREPSRVVAAGGGEEGAAYLSYRHNVETKNGKALLDQMTPAMKSAIATDMHATPITESALESWAFMQSMPPGKVDVVGGVRDPDGTRLELRKTSGDQQTFGTARLVRDHGTWRVAEEKWR